MPDGFLFVQGKIIASLTVARTRIPMQLGSLLYMYKQHAQRTYIVKVGVAGQTMQAGADLNGALT